MAKKITRLSELSPDVRNANKGTQRGRGMVEASLREVGAGRSIVVDKDGRVIAGNKTLEAAADIGLEIEVIHTDGKRLIVVQRDDLDLSDDTGHARKLAYLDNQASSVGLAWDAEILLADLNAGVSFNGIFNTEELDAMLAGLVEKETVQDPGADISKADELREKWQTATGQLWAMGEHRLICGDCTERTVVERLMGGEKAQMMFTDPPYGISFSGQLLSNTTIGGIQVNHYMGANTKHNVIQNDELTGDALTDLCLSFLEQAKKTDVKAWYICFSQLDLDLLLSAMRMIGFEWRSIIAWVKNQATLSNRDYKMRYEPIVYGQSGGAFHGERYHEEDVWEITRTLKNDLHPTMKPVDLVERAVRNSSVDGDIVFEPFAGSGTTIIACENLGRKARAVEIDASYCAVILERFHVATGKMPVLMSS